MNNNLINENIVTAVIVNYKTEDLVYKAVWSLATIYPTLSILVINNSVNEDSKIFFDELQNEIVHLNVIHKEENLHHGPALDYAFQNIKSEWMLSFDSDCIAFRSGFIEAMLNETNDKVFAVGHKLFLDDNGFNVESTNDGHDYIHPYCAIYRRGLYTQLKPFEKHGSPCLKNQIDAKKKYYELIHFPIDKYVFHAWRGTASRHGYNLGAKSKIDYLKKRIIELFKKP